MSEQRTIVFTDGAAKRNPGPGGWGVVIVSPDGRVTELGGGAAVTTNNRMELTGAISALAHLQRTSGPLAVYTDSTYVIQGIRDWIHNWKRRGWKTSTGADVVNRDLWEDLSRLTAARPARSIAWHYVRGHAGTPGNERVDEIADSFAVHRPVTLYDGPLPGYPVAILDLPDETSVPARRAANGGAARQKKSAAHSYLSVVDGKPLRHATWAECEARVTGRPGARFKKAASAADEADILKAWRFAPDDLDR